MQRGNLSIPSSAFAAFDHLIPGTTASNNMQLEKITTVDTFFAPVSDYVSKFLQHVICGEAEAVKAMLEKDISLLLEKGYAFDLSDRKIYGTAFQIALGADDMNPYHTLYSTPDMCRMLASFFDVLPDGAKIRLEQFNEQFPEGLPHDKPLLSDPDFIEYIEFYKKVIQVIATDPCTNGEINQNTKAIIDALRKRIGGEIVIRNGLHFDERIFLAALIAHDDPATFRLFENEQQRLVYCVQIIGTLQRLFTANFAQIFCFGINKFASKQTSLSRSVKAGDGTDFFDPQLGVSHFVYSYDWSSQQKYPLGMPWSGENKMSGPLFVYLHDKQKLRHEFIAELKRAAEEKVVSQSPRPR